MQGRWNMKKIVALLIIILLTTGCNIKKVEETSFNGIIQSILYQDTKLTNTSFEGYKFYLPRSLRVSDQKGANLEIQGDKNTYYLYVDMISYYYKNKSTHEKTNKFYSVDLNYNNKFGYIDISKTDNIYFIEAYYNYAKVETYVKENDLNDAFINICYILATIDYNDATIKYRLNDEEFKATGEEFDIFKSKKNNDNFLECIEKYDKYEDKTTKDQDIIDPDE